MRYRTLRVTGVEVSTLSLGMMLLGPWAGVAEEDAIAVVHRALDAVDAAVTPGTTIADAVDHYSLAVAGDRDGRRRPLERS